MKKITAALLIYFTATLAFAGQCPNLSGTYFYTAPSSNSTNHFLTAIQSAKKGVVTYHLKYYFDPESPTSGWREDFTADGVNHHMDHNDNESINSTDFFETCNNNVLQRVSNSILEEKSNHGITTEIRSISIFFDPDSNLIIRDSRTISYPDGSSISEVQNDKYVRQSSQVK